jgi:hypothetical protein
MSRSRKGDNFMDQFITVCYNIARAMQVGGGLAAICLGVAGYQFMAGGRNAKEIGKGTIIGVCIGLGCLGGCTVLAEWLKSLLTF